MHADYDAVSDLVLRLSAAPPEIRIMRALLALACAAVLAAPSLPAEAHNCFSGRCPLPLHFPRAATPYPAAHLQRIHRHCPAPADFGMYRRQHLRLDCAAPLVVIDEPGGVTLVRDR
jgi:hypothetical protein